MQDVHNRSNRTRGGVLVALAGAMLWTLTLQPAAACDDPVYVVARQKWPLQPYTLMVAHQPGNFDLAAFEATIESARKDWLTEQVNLYPLSLDLSRPPQLSHDRRMLSDMGLAGYPMIVLLDGEGKVIHRFDDLAEARDRLSKEDPDNPRPFGAPPLVELDAPPARIVVLYDSELKRNDPANPDAAATPTADLARAWADDIAATPLAETARADTVDLRNPGGDAALVEAMGLRPLPAVALVDPDGQVIRQFDAPPTEAELRKLCLSPTRDRILRTIFPTPSANASSESDTAMVILFCYGSDVQANADSLAATREAADLAAAMFDVRVPVIEMDPADEREAFFAKLIRHTPNQAQPTVVPIIGQGKAMDVFTGPIRTEPVLDLIQLAFRPCGCETVPRDFGWDLLMGPGKNNWAAFDSPMAAKISSATPAATMEQRNEELVAAAFGSGPTTWLILGGAGLFAVALIGGLLVWAKARTLQTAGR